MALTKVKADGLTADLIDETKLADNSIDSEHYNDGSIDNAHLADDAVGVAELSATGTASSSTFLRGDNSWVTPTDTNTQLAFANDANNRVVTGDGSGGLNGEANLTFDGTTLKTTASTDAELKITAGNATSQSRILFEDSAAVDGVITYDHNDRLLHIGAGTSTATDGDLIIDSSGNVGIGEASPDANLHINGGTSNNVLKLESTDGTCSMEFYDNATTNGNQPIVGGKGNNFYVETGGSERFRVKSDGHVSIASGNLEFANGAGIDFSNVPDGSRSIGTDGNKFDDYEEGSFTPNIYGSSSAGTTTHSYRTGRYVKVGKLVTCHIYVDWAAASGTGVLQIGGLPFTVHNDTGDGGLQMGGPLMHNNIDYPSGYEDGYLTSHTWYGIDYIRLYACSTGAGWAAVQMQASKAVIFTMTYSAA